MDASAPKLTTAALRVLGTMISSPADELSGAEIGRLTKLRSGTLYPLLFRFEEAKWVESRWEEGDPRLLGRPRRRYYRITPLGAQNARTEMAELGAAFGGLAWT